MNVQDLIAAIIDPEDRPDKPLWHDGTLYLTDGRILVVVPNQPQPESCWLLHGDFFSEKPEKQDRWRSIKADGVFKLSVPCDFAPFGPIEVKGPPSGLNALWQSMQECDSCHGRGWRRCDMDHEHDCIECDGEGELMQEAACAGDLVPVGELTLKRQYAWLVSQLPGVVVGKCPTMEALAFRFDGGHGLVMGVKK